MTTTPKARRFRIRRTGAPGSETGAPPPGAPEETPAASPGAAAPAPAQDGGQAAPRAPAAPDAPAAPAPKPAAQTEPAAPRPKAPPKAPKPGAGDGANPVATEIDDIRREGLTGRQLRMARRLAHRHGMAPTSDFDAVRQLRRAGIDPFERANMLALVVADPKDDAGTDAQLPKVVPQPGTGAPGRDLSTDVTDPGTLRAREVQDIQRDIARRRRRSLVMLGARLSAFVILPTLVAAFYWFVVATPMYATQSEFVIQQADSGGGAGMGGLLSGTGLATSQDSITVQSYLQSREAMLRLDADLGFRAHFADPSVDWFQRLDPDATNEEAYGVYRKMVKIGYDPTEGIVRMEVSATDPAVSAAFSSALISYAEDQVDNLTQRLREDQMKGAREVFDDAEAKMVAAQERVLTLQEQLGVLDPVSESSSLMGQINTFEIQLSEKRLQLQQLLDNEAPNQARVSGVEGDIARLETLIAQMRGQLTQSTGSTGSLAQTTSQLRVAEVDLETRTMMMQEALQSLEAARTEANRQVRYLSLGVNPVPPDEPTYPRALENTALALLIFAGIYLMISLTVSILKEQVSG